MKPLRLLAFWGLIAVVVLPFWLMAPPGRDAGTILMLYATALLGSFVTNEINKHENNDRNNGNNGH